MLSFAGELWEFIRVRKKFWLLPILVMLAIFGGLIVLTQGSAIAPFVVWLGFVPGALVFQETFATQAVLVPVPLIICSQSTFACVKSAPEYPSEPCMKWM